MQLGGRLCPEIFVGIEENYICIYRACVSLVFSVTMTNSFLNFNLRRSLPLNFSTKTDSQKLFNCFRYTKSASAPCNRQIIFW